MPLETYIFDIMEGRRSGRSFLQALSYLYRAGIAIRNRMYDNGFFRCLDIGIPVISVGNIVAGGTGKTPLVEFLAKHLLQTSQVAILSRGYRSKIEKTGQSVLVDSTTDVFYCGDEPFWLSRKLQKAQVWAGKYRIHSAFQAKQKGAEVIVMDDGMQHRALKRDFEIVVVDGDDPFGKGFYLPRGFLRDSPFRLEKADIIAVTQTEDPSSVEKKLRRYTEAPLVFVRTKTTSSLYGKKVAVFCAIAKPWRFLRTVHQAGGEVVATFFKPDHDPFFPEELHHFAERSAAEVLICTEKDAVKFPSNFSTSLPIHTLPIEIEIYQGEEVWNQFLTNIQKRIKND